MKRFKRNITPRRKPPVHDRQGSVLIVVITLLTALMVLGFFMFTRAAQDQQNSLYFADGSKNIQPQLNQDTVFDSYLRQLILGSAPTEYNSVFYNGSKSLLPGMFGTDFAPFSGEGVRLRWPTATAGGTDYIPGAPLVVDMNNDEVGEAANSYMLEINNSPAGLGTVRSVLDTSTTPSHQLPQPDVGYTYPDHTSPWLTYYGYVPVVNNAGQRFGSQLVILPSMHRPQLVRDTGIPQANWYSDPATAGRVFRPHRQHIAFDNTGNPQGRRYEDGTLGTGLTPLNFAAVPNDGHWGGVNVAAAAPQYDADPTGRGWNDAVYVDIGFPIQTDPLTGQQYVPLVAATILDAEAYLNLNIHGNTNEYMAGADITAQPVGGTVAPGPSPWAGSTKLISRSDKGVSRSEVNPVWALNSGWVPPTYVTGPVENSINGADFNVADPAEQARLLFNRNPANWFEAGNMDLFCLLHGRPIFDPAAAAPGTPADIVQLVAGRYGESLLLESAIDNTMGMHQFAAFPQPGTRGTDDNGNQSWGAILGYGAFSHPLSIFGVGTATEVPDYKSRLIYHHNSGPMAFAQYNNMYTNSNITWATSFGPGTLLTGNSQPILVLDEPDETVAEPSLASTQPNDQIYGASTNAALQMTRFDLTTNNFSDRTSSLAPFNFLYGNREEAIRSLFGTTSSDLKAYSHTVHDSSLVNNAFRPWEFIPQSLTDSIFPNNSTSVFRPELYQLLYMFTGNHRNDPDQFRKLQRKLSINGVLDTDSSNNLRFRPLTPHPTGLGNTPIVHNAGLVRREQLTGPPAQQEDLARSDRQRMARDIYTLLYIYGSGDDSATGNPFTNNNLYTPEQCREMAQFAVNVVDNLDPDHVITRFEYDTNLANGWGVDDNAYSTGDGGTDRQEVFGVEEQQLAFSEILAIIARRTEDGAGMPANHTATEWTDTQVSSFFFVELENASPRDATIQGGWQLIVRSPDNPTTPVVQYRRVKLQNSAAVPGGGRTTIGTMNVANPDLDGNGNAGPSRFRLDPNGGTTFEDIAPPTGVTLDIDLIETPSKAVVTDNMNPATSLSENQILELNSSITDPSNSDYENTAVEVVLLRRSNLNRILPPDDTGAESDDNPWVVADRMRVNLEIFDLGASTADNTNSSGAPVARIREELEDQGAPTDAIRSTMRYQALFGKPTPLADPESQFDFTTTGENPIIGAPPNAMDPERFRKNTLGRRNRPIDTATTPGANHNNQLWQPHFNRDYASLSELFSVPLYGPEVLDPDPMTTPFDEIKELTFVMGEINGGTTGHHAVLVDTETFGNRALNPDPDNNSYPPASADYSMDNRWHRALNFLEVPRRQGIAGFDEVVGRVANNQQDTVYRNHGPLNPNTMRNPEILGAMLDDVRVMGLDLSSDPNLPALLDVAGDAERTDWWTALVLARDQGDPAAVGLPNPTDRFLAPGVPGVSRPFRPLSYSDDGARSLEHTLLRSLERDSIAPPARSRQLFELGNATNHTNQTIDPSEKYRLLGKAMNHSTTTSNTFYIFLQVDYFEAQYFNNAVRIGAKLASSPGYRGFFVVDRAKALDMVTDDDLPPTTDTNTGASLFSFNQNFDWRSLVLYRRRLN